MAGRVVIVVEDGIRVEDCIFGPPTIVLAIASSSLVSSSIWRSTDSSADSEATWARQRATSSCPVPSLLSSSLICVSNFLIWSLRVLRSPSLVPLPAVSNWRFVWRSSSWSWWLRCRTCFVCSLEMFSRCLAFSSSISRDSFCCSNWWSLVVVPWERERERGREGEREGERREKERGMKKI